MKTDKHRISLIIPTLNEAGTLGPLLEYLLEKRAPDHLLEILVVDGGSEDATLAIAEAHGANALLSERGRAVQMNHGASHARGDILYFLHADTFPPRGFDQHIVQAVDSGFEAGSFRMRFDSNSRFLRFFSWFTRFNYIICRGGDQSLFVTRKLFGDCGGFNEAYRIYEDCEFIRRLYRRTAFTVRPETVITSARRYRQKKMLRLQFHFAMMHLINYLGAGPEVLYRYYRKNIAL